MYTTFNMGTGMILAVGSKDADKALEILQGEGNEAKIIGEIEKLRDERVVIV